MCDYGGYVHLYRFVRTAARLLQPGCRMRVLGRSNVDRHGVCASTSSAPMQSPQRPVPLHLAHRLRLCGRPLGCSSPAAGCVRHCGLRCGGAGGCCVVCSTFSMLALHAVAANSSDTTASPCESEPVGAGAHLAERSHLQPRRVQRDWRRGLQEPLPGERRHRAAS